MAQMCNSSFNASHGAKRRYPTASPADVTANWEDWSFAVTVPPSKGNIYERATFGQVIERAKHETPKSYFHLRDGGNLEPPGTPPLRRAPLHGAAQLQAVQEEDKTRSINGHMKPMRS